MGTTAIPHDRGGFEAMLPMLQHVATHIWTAARWMDTVPQDTQWASLCLGVWQSPHLLCTMHTCWSPYSSLLFRWWPLTVPGEAAGFLYEGEPDGGPQAILRIGFGERPEEEQWPEDVRELISRRMLQRNKVKSQRWNFLPDGLDPFIEELQRAKRTRGKTRAQQEAERDRLQKLDRLIKSRRVQEGGQSPGPLFQRTLYVSPEQKGVERICLLLVVFLFQVRLIWRPEEARTLSEWAVCYLVARWRCVDEGHAYIVFDSLLHYMVGNEHWKASGKYIARVVKDTRDGRDTNVSTVALEPEDAERLKVERRSGRCAYHKQLQKDTYSIYTILRIVAEESNGQWTPSYDAVHKWITEGLRWYGRVSAVRDRKNEIQVTEEGLTKVRAIVEAERARKRLRKKAESCNYLDAYQKLLQRKKKPDGTPDWEAIEAHIDRYKTKKVEGKWLSLENRIAECQARLGEAEPGSAKWIDAFDTLNHLHRMPQGTDT